ncbi:uncharacterized protein DUF3426 [Luteimonas cucumeris]|uniref:Uncharacterized protein DUF3426 n=1 Tax=Luteimonas cucumeris TaxID=985012 RepID=A0A562LEQ4_9GAMM|nr:DUF3426 domain-containing protein [Luteimonas cucumeris]TWI06085.1 uncharacterized protein DUF3426 [Luteimonas cucumeris]
MFVQCPRCHSLVATDPVTGAPPEYCPYCDGPMAAVVAATNEEDTAPAAAEPTVDVDPVAADDEAPEVPIADDESDAADAESNDIADTDAMVEDIVDEEDHAIAEPSPPGTATTTTPDDQSRTPPAATPHDSADIDAVDDETATEPLEAAPAKPAKRKRTAPSFVRRQAAIKRTTPRRMWFIAAALALLAVVQIVLADRAQLAANERWRPMIVSVCNVLHCTVPPWREPSAFAMLGRDVRQHPYMPGALRVDATFRNNARWPQPWPELVLTLSDINGRALGMRTFSPKEYLDRKVTQKQIASGQSAAIRMEIMEPAAGVVSFSFDFH